MSQYAIGVGLLFLAVGGNFVGDLLGCGIKKTLTANKYAKHLFAFLMVTLLIVAVDKSTYADTKKNQWVSGELVKNSLLTYGLFIGLSKTEVVFASAIIVLLIGSLLLSFEKSNKDEQTIAGIDTVQQIMSFIMLILLVVGVWRYYNRQKRDHKKFSMQEFWFGVGCKK